MNEIELPDYNGLTVDEVRQQLRIESPDDDLEVLNFDTASSWHLRLAWKLFGLAVSFLMLALRTANWQERNG